MSAPWLSVGGRDLTKLFFLQNYSLILSPLIDPLPWPYCHWQYWQCLVKWVNIIVICCWTQTKQKEKKVLAGWHCLWESLCKWGKSGKVFDLHYETRQGSPIAMHWLQTLPDATPSIGKIHQFRKRAVTFEPMMQFLNPLRFRIS